jgi:hypothetical protein
MKPFSTLAIAGLFAYATGVNADAPKSSSLPTTCDTACQQDIVDQSRMIGLGTALVSGLAFYGLRRKP